MSDDRTLAIDPSLSVALQRLSPLTRSVRPDDIAMMRSGTERFRPCDASLSRSGAVEVEERTIPGGEEGPAIPLLILRPASLTPPHSCVFYIHGGGMISGDARTGIETVLDWVTELGVTIVSPTYRLAPEHPHPAPVEDCWRALAWVVANAGGLGLAERPPIVAGTSAGGGLAAGMALLARERSTLTIGALLLMAPMLDDRCATPSARRYAGDVPWDAESNRTGWRALLGEVCCTPLVPATAAPARADDLTGLPPTYIDVGSVETFHDEAVTFAERLASAGVPTTLHVWEGAFHGFDALVPDAAISRTARTARLSWLMEQA